jgi:hypothetical protein
MQKASDSLLESTSMQSSSDEAESHRRLASHFEEVEAVLQWSSFATETDRAEAETVREHGMNKLNRLRGQLSILSEKLQVMRRAALAPGDGTQVDLTHITFNAGGSFFSADASRWDLARCGVLGQLLDGTFDTVVSDDGSVFVDLNPMLFGRVFEYIANGFRLPSTWKPQNEDHFAQLVRLGEQLEVHGFARALRGNVAAARSQRRPLVTRDLNPAPTVIEFSDYLFQLFEEADQRLDELIDLLQFNRARNERRLAGLRQLNATDPVMLRLGAERLCISEARMTAYNANFHTLVMGQAVGPDGLRELPPVGADSYEAYCLLFDVLRGSAVERRSDAVSAALEQLCLMFRLEKLTFCHTTIERDVFCVVACEEENMLIRTEDDSVIGNHSHNANGCAWGRHRLVPLVRSHVWTFGYKTRSFVAVGVALLRDGKLVREWIAELTAPAYHSACKELTPVRVGNLPHGTRLGLVVSGTSLHIGIDTPDAQALGWATVFTDVDRSDGELVFTAILGPRSTVCFF